MFGKKNHIMKAVAMHGAINFISNIFFFQNIFAIELETFHFVWKMMIKKAIDINNIGLII